MILLSVICFFLNLHSQNLSDSKIDITIDKNYQRTKTYLTYSFKFSHFSEILSFYLIPSDFYYSVYSIRLRDSFRFKYYGYSTYPFRYFLSEKKKIDFDSNQTVTDGNENSYRNKETYLKLSLNPLFEDVKENINWYLFDLTIKSFSQDWNSIGTREKREFLNDLSLIDIPFVENILPKVSTSTQKR